jgi:hypothetical protein
MNKREIYAASSIRRCMLIFVLERMCRSWMNECERGIKVNKEEKKRTNKRKYVRSSRNKSKVSFFFTVSFSFLSLSSIIYLSFSQCVCMSMYAQCRSFITFAIWDGDDGWWKFEDVINSETQQQVSLTFSYKCNNDTRIVLSSMTNVYW